MSDESGSTVDVVVFFDANMPKMDRCSDNCKDKSLVFCKHRFNFGARIERLSGDNNKFSDFAVIRYYFKLIQTNNWAIQQTKPLFIFITRDTNFIKDVKLDYFNERQNSTANIELSFNSDFIKCGDIKMIIVAIQHKPYGSDSFEDLRQMIKKLNKLWAEKRTL